MGHFTKAEVLRMQAAGLTARNGTAPPPAAKARKKTGTGDWAQRKQWWAEMARGDGYFMAIKTVTEKNTGGGWRGKAERAEAQRRQADTTIWEMIRQHKHTLPVTVTLTRYGDRILDDDNAVSALAHVRDGIADAFGCDDSNNGKIVWKYADQVKSPRGCYGVRILIVASAVVPQSPPAG